MVIVESGQLGNTARCEWIRKMASTFTQYYARKWNACCCCSQCKKNEATALISNGKIITLPWEGLSWARPKINDSTWGRQPKKAYEILKPGDVIWVQNNSDGTWWLSQVPKAQCALVSLNPQNGAITSLVGGYDYRLSSFNRIIQAQRQPGSSFKPFIYAAAFDKGFTLASVINDAPIVIWDPGAGKL